MSQNKISVMAIGASTGHPQRRVNAIKKAGGEITLISDLSSSSLPKAINYFLRPWKFVSEQKRIRPDVYHLHGMYGTLPALATILKNRPVIATAMGADIYFKEQVGPHLTSRALVRLCLEYADVITSKSAAMTDRLVQMGVSASKIHLINWGVDCDAFKPLLAHERLNSVWRDRLQLPCDDVPVLFSPRWMSPLYNVHMIIQAAAKLTVPFYLVMVDYYPEDELAYRNYCHQLVKSLGLEKCVRFISLQNFSDMPSLYGLSDVCISVPLSDGLPQSAYEAMACGAAVVLSDLVNYRGVFPNDTCVVVENTVDGLAMALNTLLTIPLLKEKIAANGRDFVLRHASQEANIERVMSLYTSLAKQRTYTRISALARCWGFLLYVLQPFETVARRWFNSIHFFRRQRV